MAYDCIQFRSHDPSAPKDSELALTSSYRESLRLEPISPPPSQMDVSRLSSRPSLSRLSDNYEKYLSSLPQKQKEYHHLVMAARNNANFPLNKLSAPLLLAKQQQTLIQSQYFQQQQQMPWNPQKIIQRPDQTLKYNSIQAQSSHPLPAYNQQMAIQPRNCCSPPVTIHCPQSGQQNQRPNQAVISQTLRAQYPQQNLHSVNTFRHSAQHSIQHPVPHSVQPMTHSRQQLPHSGHSRHSPHSGQPVPHSGHLRQSPHSVQQISRLRQPMPYSVQPMTHSNHSALNVRAIPLSVHSMTQNIPHSVHSVSHSMSTPVSNNSGLNSSHLLHSQLNRSLNSPVIQRIDSNQRQRESRVANKELLMFPLQDQRNDGMCSQCTDLCSPQNCFQRRYNDLNHSRLVSRDEKWSQSLSRTPPKQHSVIISPKQNIPEMPSFACIQKRITKTRGSPQTVKQILDTSRQRPMYPKLMTAVVSQPPTSSTFKPYAMTVTNAVIHTKKKLATLHPKVVPSVTKADTNNNHIFRPHLIGSDYGLQKSQEMPLNLKIMRETAEEDDDCLVLKHFRRESQESEKNSSRNSSLSCDSIRLRISETPPLFEDNSKPDEDMVEKIADLIETIEDKSEEECQDNEEMSKTSEEMRHNSNQTLLSTPEEEEEESEQEFERRLHLILDLLIDPKKEKSLIEPRMESPPILTPELKTNEESEVIAIEYKSDKHEFVRTLDLIRGRDLKRKPIAYLNSRHPMNDISRSIYAGIATKKSVLDFPPLKHRPLKEESTEGLKRKRYSLWTKSSDDRNSSERNDWSYILKQMDFSSPLSQRVIGVLPQFQFR